MKAGWKVKRLGELGSAIREQAKIVPDVEYELWSVPSFENGIPETAIGKDIGSAKLRIRPDDVLICKINPRINRIWLVGKPVNGCEQIGSTEWLVYRAKSDAGLLLNWLIHFVSAPRFREWIVSEVSGATGSHTRAKADGILQQEIPVPPLPEQHRIVGILNSAFDGIATATANAEKNLHNARALFESYLQSVFTQKDEGWIERRLGDVFDIGSSKRIRETEWTSSGVPFYGGKEIVKLAKFGSAVSNAYISEEKYDGYASKYDMPRKGDILITARGTIGVGYVVKEGDKFYYKDGNIISFREKTPTNPFFVLYAFRSKPLIEQFADLTGTTVTHLPIERAKSLILKMPSFATQNFVVDHLGNIENETQRLESIYEQKLAALDSLKKSLLHQAFTGQL